MVDYLFKPVIALVIVLAGFGVEQFKKIRREDKLDETEVEDYAELKERLITEWILITIVLCILNFLNP